MSHLSPIQILIVDDHAVVRQGLRMVLSLRPALRVVGEAGTGDDALQMALDLQPDLVLLDLILPDANGAQLVPELRKLSPKSRILVLSGVQSIPLVRRAVEAGVDGYILKEVTPDELIRAIYQVMEGQPFLQPKITALLSRQLREDRQFMPPDPLVHIPPLTRREQQVLELMATTATNREIAERLVVSEETVRSHVKSVLRKLNQNTRTQAVVEALRLGLIEL